MSEKIVTVYLDTGAAIEHILEVEDDDDYLKEMNNYLHSLNGHPKSIMGFSSPLVLYKVEHIIAIEFSDPPPNNKLPIGFLKSK